MVEVFCSFLIKAAIVTEEQGVFFTQRKVRYYPYSLSFLQLAKFDDCIILLVGGSTTASYSLDSTEVDGPIMMKLTIVSMKLTFYPFLIPWPFTDIDNIVSH